MWFTRRFKIKVKGANGKLEEFCKKTKNIFKTFQSLAEQIFNSDLEL
jgi:hypothetical protein